MASAKGIKKRRKTTQNIYKITRTMELVATSRLRMASQKLANFQKYRDKMEQILRHLLEQDSTHPLCLKANVEEKFPIKDIEEKSAKKKVTLFVITGNRGLCGNYNLNLLQNIAKFRDEMVQEGNPLSIYLAGRKGIVMCKFHNIPLAQTYPNFSDQPTWDDMEPLARTFINLYENGETNEIWLLYTSKTKVVKRMLLPIVPQSSQKSVPSGMTQTGRNPAPDSTHSMQKNQALEKPSESGNIPNQEKISVSGKNENTALKSQKNPSWISDFYYWPNVKEILNELIPTFIRARLWETFLEAAASEQSLRMFAMKTASENAQEMIKRLTQKYNRARQTQITQEILEILRGAQRKE